jgi:probable rRNA maturation factor
LAAAVGGRDEGAHGIVAVALADDPLIHDLNFRFRAVDLPTNVLSFPSGEPPGEDAHLGDVVLSIDTLRREAAAEGTPLDAHFAHLAVHGLLHILGYDHEAEADAAAMEAMESEILAELGVPDPYGREPVH